MKIYTVVGARPQFIKAAALNKAFKKLKSENTNLEEKIIHTGQHFDKNMSDNFFSELEIDEPLYNLNINRGTHGSNTGRMIEELEKIFIKDCPNGVLIYGDTDSTLAGAIAASKLNIPLFHVEAGLRSFNKKQPEEINRVIADHLSSICFTPTKQGKLNLIKESIKKNNIVKTGDVMADAARIFSIKKSSSSKFLKTLDLKPKNFILLTIHRKENTDDKKNLTEILKAISEINIPILLPLHPRTRKKIIQFNLEKYLTNLKIIEPISFKKMLMLEKNASLIVTDSGGIQKEAYLQKTPVVTLREETEWVELVDNGFNLLVKPLTKENIKECINTQLKLDLKKFDKKLYGNGHSSEKIVTLIHKFLLKFQNGT